jgi:hypothetical protein
MRGLAHVVIALLLAACGRIGFDTTAVTGVPAVVQSQSVLIIPPMTPVVGLSPTLAGDVIAVATSNIDASDQPLVSISDNIGDTFQSAHCNYIFATTTGEIWYAVTRGDALQISIVDSSPVRREIWVLEIAHADELIAMTSVSNASASPVSPIDAGPTAPVDASGDLIASAPTVTVTPTRVPAIVFSLFNTGEEQALEGNFTALPVLNGDDAAWLVVEAPGSYSPAWLVNNDEPLFGAASVAFAPP